MNNRRRLLLSGGGVKPHTKGVINGVIQDDWKQIVINCQADKAKEYYQVGDHAPLTLEGIGTFDFDYLGSGLDVRADGQYLPVSTWLCRTIPASSKWNNRATTSGGWGASLIRSYCRTTVYNSLPDEIRDNIVEVNKISYDKTTVDNVWIPSGEEAIYTNSTYQARFPDDSSRIKTGDHSYWWLRTPFHGDDRSAWCVYSDGKAETNTADCTRGVVPGFCL